MYFSMSKDKYIVSIIFHIGSGNESKPINRFSGLMVRTYLYKFLQDLLGVSDRHSDKGLREYSATPIYSVDGHRIRVYRRGDRVGDAYFKINLLSVDEPQELLMKLGGLRDIEVDTHRFGIYDISLNIVSYMGLLQNSQPIKKFRMSFLSPTSLRSPSHYIAVEMSEGKAVPMVKRKSRRVGFYIPLPYPDLIFRNLLRMFRRFSGIEDIPYEEVRNYIANDGVYIAGYPNGIRTDVLRVGRGETYIGFRGTIFFRCSESGGELNKYIHMLLRFSEYSNIGVGRTAGLGWVKAMVTR